MRSTETTVAVVEVASVTISPPKLELPPLAEGEYAVFESQGTGGDAEQEVRTRNDIGNSAVTANFIIPVILIVIVELG